MGKSKLEFKNAMLNNGSIICILGGDQTEMWAQELSIIKCAIPLDDARLLFEIYNRRNDEYNNEDLNYSGLDNLIDEVVYARKQMKIKQKDGYTYEKIYDSVSFFNYLKTIVEKESDRYSSLLKYIEYAEDNEYFDKNSYSLKDIIYNNAIDEKKYYWIDQCRVNKKDYENQTGNSFNNWYEIAELYAADKELPFDLTDEDIVSIFGFEKFEAFCDLSKVNSGKKRLNVNKDFIIELDQSYLYDEQSEDNILTIIKPKDNLSGTKDYLTIKDEDMVCSIGFTLRQTFDSVNDDKFSQINFKKMIDDLYEQSEKSLASNIKNDAFILTHGEFRKIHKVLIDKPSLKVGYYTMRVLADDALGKLQLTKYVGVIITKKAYYFCSIRYDFFGENSQIVENFIEDLLNTIQLLDN